MENFKFQKLSKLQASKLFLSSFFWKDHRSEWPQYLFEILSNLQLISIIFLESSKILIKTTEEGTLLEILQKASQVLHLIDLSSINRDIIVANVVFIIICCYFAVFLALLGFTAYQFLTNYRLSDFFHSLLTYWVQSHHTLLFFPINFFLISFFSNDVSKRTFVFNIPGTNWGIITGVTLLVLFNQLLALLGARFCYDPFLTDNPFACYKPTFQKLTFLCKAVIGPLSFLMDREDRKWVLVGISFALTLIRYELTLYETPFYKYSSLKLTSLLASSSFGIALATMIIAITFDSDSRNSMDFIYVLSVTICMLLILTTKRIQLIIERNMSLPPSALNNKKNILRRIFSLTYFIDSSNFSLGSGSKKICNTELLYITGDTLSHTSTCKNERCICRYLLEQGKESTGLFTINKVVERSRENIKLNLLKQAIKTLKNSNKLKILYASILVKEIKDFLTTQATISEINHFRSFEEEILIFIVSQDLENEMGKFLSKTQEKNEKVLNAKVFIDNERDSELLSSLIKQNTKSYTDLWTSYQQSNKSCRECMSKSIAFENEAEKVEKLWDQIFKRSLNVPRMITAMYSAYLSVVRNQPSQAEKIFNKKEMNRIQQQINRLTDRKNLDETTDVIIYMSMAKDRLGRVLHVSKSIYKELGWSQKEIINQNIGLIQPPFVREKHQQILLRHKENSQGPFGASFKLFALNKDGYLVPADCYVTIFPYVKAEPIYIGIMHTKPLTQEIMIVRSDGMVDSFSEGIAKSLDLKSYKEININQMCTNFKFMAQSKFNEDEIEGLLELLNKEKYLHFQINSLDKSSTMKRELSFVVEAQRLTVLNEHSLCLNLTYKNMEKVSPKRTDWNIAIVDHPNIENAFDNYVPEENEISPYLASVGKVSESQPFSSFIQEKKWLSIRITSPQNAPRGTDNILKTSQSNFKPKIFSTNMIEDGITITRNTQTTTERKPLTKASSKEGSVTSRKKADIQKKIEEAVYILPKPKYMKLLNYQLALFAILCIGFLCFQLADNLSEFDALREKIDIIASYQKVAFYFLSINWHTKMIALNIAGLLADARHAAMGIPSHLLYSQFIVLRCYQLMDEYNDNIIRKLHILDQSTLDKVYSYRITPIEQDSDPSNRTVNFFEMINEVGTAGLKMSMTKWSELPTIPQTINFILDNTLNDLLLANEHIVEDLTNDYESNLYRIRTKTSLLLVIAVFCSLPSIILFIQHIREVINKRNQMIEILEKVDETMLNSHLNLVNTFYHTLENNEFSIKTYFKIKCELQRNLEQTNLKTKKENIKSKSKKGLNTQIIQTLFLTFVAILIFISVFVILAFKFEAKLSELLVEKTNMLQLNQFRIDFTLQNTYFMTYLSQTKPTYARGNPVEKELERLFAKGTYFPNIFLGLVEGTEGATKAILETVIFGNLCQALVDDYYPIIACLKVTEIIGSNGLIALFPDFFRIQSDMKSSFDLSGHSLQEAVVSLNSKSQILYEEMGLFMESTMGSIELMFKEDLRQSVLSYRTQVSVIIIAYVFVYVVVAGILSIKVWKIINKQRDDWRKILRQIPCPMISLNKVLKNYLTNDCEHILDSYKNMM